MSHRPVRLAVLGLGFMGSTHLKALRDLPGCLLTAVFSSDEKKLRGDLTAVRGNLGGPGEKLDFSGITTHRTLEAAIADPSVDAVDICLPTDLHEPVAVAAMRAGKHVLVEKPMALDGFAVDRMTSAAARYRRILMTAQVLRFLPAYRVLREQQLGRLQFALFRRSCAAPAWSGWLQNIAQSGGGVFDLLIHDVDIALNLFGKPESLAACGVSEKPPGVDWMNAQLYYPDGAVIAIVGGWHHPGAYPFSMEYSVTLEGGTWEYSSRDGMPKLYVQGEAAREFAAGDRDGYRIEIEYFLECCRSGEPPALCPPQESAEAVKVMRLLLESRNRGGRRMLCKV